MSMKGEVMTDETNDKEKEVVEEKSEVESSDAVDGKETDDAGAPQNNAPDYGMILDAIKRIEDNQTRLAGQVAKISDAQSVLVNSGAIIHEDSDPDSDAADNDEFIPIDQLDLSI